jgi:hypothetical protein
METQLCYQDILNNFNMFLGRCRTSFVLRCVNTQEDEEIQIELKRFVDSQEGFCHPYMATQYALIAFDSYTEQIVAYISFSAFEGYPNSFYPVENDIINAKYKVIILDFMCTSSDYVRQGLSVLLTLLIISYALKDKFDAVVAATNKDSGSLLEYKFGFERLFGVDYFMKDLYLTEGQLINAKLVLKSEYLGKYNEVYENLQNCTIIKPKS